MSLSDEREIWVPLSIKDEVTALIDEGKTGPEWSKTEIIDDKSVSIDDYLPKDVDKLASKIVNNRIAGPVGALAYGNKGGVNYQPEQAGDAIFDGTLIADMLSGKSYGSYLTVRLFWTFALTAISTAIFYLLIWFGSSQGWMGGLLAFGTSSLFVLGWLLYRFVNERMNARRGGFFPQRSSLMPLQTVHTAMVSLDKNIQGFIDEILSFQSECIKRSDQLPDNERGNKGVSAYFRKNADAMAQSMVTWAIARRAAQYLWFQPINVGEKYEVNGVTKFRIEFCESVFTGLIVLMLALLVGSAIVIPLAFVTANEGLSVSLWAVEEQGRYFYAWPLAQAVFAAAIALWLSENDKKNYRTDRNKLTLALDDFWRRGKIRTADQISDLAVGSSDSHSHWFKKTAFEMIRVETTNQKPKDFQDALQKNYEAWDLGRKWNDELVATDPTPQLMRRYLKFLDTVGSRSVVHNRGHMSQSQRASLPAGIEPDARPRTRALATLARREIWHP